MSTSPTKKTPMTHQITDAETKVAAQGLAAEATPDFDIIELGFPLMEDAGLAAVTALKQAFPDKAVLADLNVAAGDAAAAEIFKAGADLVRVSGGTNDSTIAGVVRAAAAHHRGIVVDLSGVPDKAVRAKEVLKLGASFVEFLPGLMSRPTRAII
jgi:3-hexulose-6-phosphate synthase